MATKSGPVAVRLVAPLRVKLASDCAVLNLDSWHQHYIPSHSFFSTPLATSRMWINLCVSNAALRRFGAVPRIGSIALWVKLKNNIYESICYIYRAAGVSRVPLESTNAI